MTKPSWQDFGTHDESAVPELWDGVVGAWAPCLGPTGSRLHDMSRRSNWGTLTNMDNATAWAVSDGQYAMDFAGASSGDEVRALSSSTGTFVAGAVTMWILPRTNQARKYHAAFSCNFTTGILIYLGTGGISGGVQVGVGTTYPIFTSAYLNADAWNHCAVVWQNKRVSLFQNGVLRGSGTSANDPVLVAATEIGGGSFSPTEVTNGLIDDVQVRSRPLSADEVLRLYQIGRGGIYQRRRRRAIYLPQAGFQAAWARGSNVMLGFNQP